VSHDVFEEHIALYAAGALERAERQALEAHLLTGCPVCHAALKESRRVAALLPYALPPVQPPPGLKSKIMRAMAQDSVAQPAANVPSKPSLEAGAWLQHIIPPPPTWRTHPAVAVVLVILLAVTAFYAMTVHDRASTTLEDRRKVETALQAEAGRIKDLQGTLQHQEQLLADLKEEFARQAGHLRELKELLAHREEELEHVRAQAVGREQELTGLRKALAQRDEMLTFLRSPTVQVVSLTGSAMAKSAGALVLFDPESKTALLYAFNMPPLPPGKTYQLWAILDRPVSAGIFTPDVGHKSRLMVRSMPDPARITKFAVSVEPEGGRPQPTGEIYLIGQL